MIREKSASGWRDHLEPDEAEQLSELDAEIKTIDARRRELSDLRRRIQNRATKRATDRELRALRDKYRQAAE